MSQTTYLWVIEWEDRFVTPQRVEFRQVTRQPGVSDEDLERHLIDVEIPAVAAVSTRVGGAERQVLLRSAGVREQATGFGQSEEGVATALGAVAVAVTGNWDVVWRSDDPAAD